MNNSNGKSHIELQLVLSAASRKKQYVIAKWFNLASFICSPMIFIVFISGGFFPFFITVVPFINTIVTFCFWFYVRRIVFTVGTLEETSHTTLGIFDLLFGNWISGILILVASSSFNHSQTLRMIASSQSAQNTL